MNGASLRGVMCGVQEGVGSAMCSYNKVNGYYACENHQTITVDLKQRMGFKGAPPRKFDHSYCTERVLEEEGRT